MFYRLLQYNIDGKVYNSMKSLYRNTILCIRINGYCSLWFRVNSWVRQNDPLSPSLFSLFINDLIKDIKCSNLGVSIGNDTVSILAYADDIFLLAESEAELQRQLDILYEWCGKWEMQVNDSKTNIVHFRNRCKPLTDYVFKFGGCALQMMKIYKYLGLLFDEFVTFEEAVKVLTDSAGRALGAILAKFKHVRDI